MNTNTRRLSLALAAATIGLGLVACAPAVTDTGDSSARDEVLGQSHAVVYENEDVTEENSEELRLESSADAEQEYGDSSDLSDQIKLRLFEWWGAWQPDYESWLEIADGLYAADADITAIGGETQKYSDYRVAMKSQREQVDMEMGPIMNITVDGNTATLVYHMYLTPKSSPDTTFDTIVTEYNTFEEVDGKLMVTDLHLYTDGGGMF